MSHARLSPSSSSTWVWCPGSISAQEGIPDQSSEYAEWGTCAHWVLEQCLIRGIAPLNLKGTHLFLTPEDTFEVPAIKNGPYYFEPYENNGMQGHLWTVDQEMCEVAQEALTETYRIRDEMLSQCADTDPVEVIAERKVDAGFLMGKRDDCSGTCDVTIVSPSKLVILDLKGGAGVVVEVEYNTQLVIYAIGAYAALNPEQRRQIQEIEMVIVQPRAYHKDGPIRRWTINVADLMQWIMFLTDAARATDTPDAPRKPGEKQCRWCRAKPTCPEIRNTVIDAMFEVVDQGQTDQQLVAQVEQTVLREPEEYSQDRIAAMLEVIPLARDFMSAVESYATELALKQGVRFPRQKLVRKDTRRKWGQSDEDTIKKITTRYKIPRAQVVQPDKPKTPAQMEKLDAIKNLNDRKKKSFLDLIVKPQGAPVLVPESDPRPELLPDVATQFEGVEGGIPKLN